MLVSCLFIYPPVKRREEPRLTYFECSGNVINASAVFWKLLGDTLSEQNPLSGLKIIISSDFGFKLINIS